MQKQKSTLSNVFIASISLFCFLFSIYCLTYSGTYITDDEHILASRTLSMAYDPEINDNRVLGNSRIFSYSSLNPIEASQGLNIEPIQAYLGSLLAKSALYFGLGHVQSIYLLNIFFTAFTAVIIFWTLLLLNYSKKTSFILGLLFGICTIAWPYSRTYFRDSVAMFFLSVTWGAYLVISSKRSKFYPTKKPKIIFWFILLLGLSIGILSKNTVLVAIPVFLLAYLFSFFKDRNYPIKGRRTFLLILLFFIPISLIWINYIPLSEKFSRFTFDYYLSIIHNIISNPHPHLLEALIGPIISPGKSVFIFSPILILSLLSLIKYFHQVWTEWMFFMFLIIVQAIFYDADWWGHVNWGLRYLLPATPLLLIACAPLVDTLLSSRKGRRILLILGSASMFMQLVGILAPIRQYYISLTNYSPSISYTTAIWNPKYSAWWWHLKWIFSGGLSELAISRVGDWSIPLLLIFFVIICCSIILITGKYKTSYSILLLIASIISSGIMLSIFRFDPANQARSDMSDTENIIQLQHKPNDIVLIKSYGTLTWSYWMNWAAPDLKWISLPYYFPNPYSKEIFQISKTPVDDPNEISKVILDEVEINYERIWLVLPEDSPGSIFNWETTYLNVNNRLIGYWYFAGNGNSTRLFLFEMNHN